MTKQEIKQIEEKLLELTGTFCAQKLNDEYSQLCEKLLKNQDERGMFLFREKSLRFGQLPLFMQ